MRLVSHQFRKDIRQFRVVLAIWLALLALDVVMNLAAFDAGPRSDASGLLQVLRVLLTCGLILMVFYIPAQAILADSPVNPDGFMATRPMPRNDWLMAKAQFILAGVVLPAVIQEFLYLQLSGLKMDYVLHGALERLLFVGLFSLAGASLAGLTRNFKELILTIAIAGGATWGLGVLFLVIMEFFLRGNYRANDYMATRGLVFIAALTATLLGSIAFVMKLRWRQWPRIALATASGVASLAAAIVWPWDFFAARPAEAATIAKIQVQDHFQVPARSLRLMSAFDGWRRQSNRMITAVVSPQLDLKVDHALVEWICRRGELSGEDHRQFSVSIPRSAGFGRWRSFYSRSELNILAGFLPTDVRFASDFIPLDDADETCSSGAFWLPKPFPECRDNLQMTWDIEGRVFRWEKVAQLDLIAGASKPDETGAWRLAAVEGNPNQTTVYLERRQVNLVTTRDQSVQVSGTWPSDRYDIFLLDLRERTAQLPMNRNIWAQEYAGHSAYTIHSMTAFFQEPSHRNSGRPGVLDDAKPLDPPQLLIFRRVYLGSVRYQWTSPNLVLDEVVQSPARQSPGLQTLGSRAEFYQRLSALKPPMPDKASQAEVARYLADTLRLVEGTGRGGDTRSLLSRQLAAYVPTHLQLFLNVLLQNEGYGSQMILSAVEQGAEETQKSAIISAMRRNPELAEVVMNRSWTENARPELVHLLNSPRRLPPAFWRAIVCLQEPETYPLLLEELELHPEAWLYDLIRTLPGIEPALDQTVDRIMARLTLNQAEAGDRVVVGNTGEPLQAYPGLEVCIKHGRPAALKKGYLLFTVLQARGQVNTWSLVQLLTRNLALEGLKPADRWNQAAVVKWLARYQPDDFQFDPVRRCFVLAR